MNLVDAVRNAGVVGAGGAGFPTHVKIAAKVDTVLANGAECEPLLYSDQMIMRRFASEVVSGLRLIMNETGAGKGLICVKNKYGEAINEFENLLASQEDISVLRMGNFYPSGDEHVLVYEATGRIVPEGGIPLAVNVLVQNVATLVNIARASAGVPVTERAVTVGGLVKRPAVHMVPIGTRLSEVIARCGGSEIDDYAVLLNGPMMGRLVDPEKEFITKTTGGVILLPVDHAYVRRMSRSLKADILFSRGSCEQCRYCTDFCPRFLQGHSLEPHKIMRVINEERDPEAATVTRSFLCCECGVCDLFACPISLSPRRFFRSFKKSLSARGIRNPHSEKPEKVDTYRDYRRVPKDKLTRMLGLAKYDIMPDFSVDRLDVDEVNIPLSMHLGAPSVSLVKAGDKVAVGDLIGEIPEGKLGARVHASIAGTVVSVNGFVRIKR